jgi:hypothetical protein
MKKNIFRGVTKAFDSNFGKLLLAATAVYLGGAALGAWPGPFSSRADAPSGGAGAQPGGAADTPSGGGAAELPMEAMASKPAQPAAATAKPGGGFISGAMSSPAGQYGLIAGAAGAVQGAFTPDSTDAIRASGQMQRDNMQWKQNFLSPNYDVGSINVGSPAAAGAQGQVRDAQGNTLYPTRDASGNIVYTPTPPAEQQPAAAMPAPKGMITRARVA